MKLQTIVELFAQPKQMGAPEPIGRKVFRSIPDFSRRVEMMTHMEQMKKICDLYHEEEQEEIKRLINEYCDEENKANKDTPGYDPLVLGKNISRVPQSKQQALFEWRQEKLESDIKVKSFAFLPEEIQAADLTVEQMIAFKQFYNQKDLQKFIKQKRQ